MTELGTLDVASWRPAISPEGTDEFAQTLESGGVLVLPRLAFALEAGEERFLDPKWSNGRAKNISFDCGTVKGARGNPDDLADLGRMIGRFAASASDLIAALLPRYAPHLKRARTSFRPQSATDRTVSWRKDDARLHIDAFPSRPNRGERILRVFCNVNPHGEDRVWRVGERFEAMAARFLPRVRKMGRVEPSLLAALYVTKGRRSEYDHLMLGLHDCAKADIDYQRNSPQQEVRFAPGTTWICYSDQVMHAAMAGQFMLEQTIHLPLSALYRPELSPLRTLERMAGRSLTA
ncbi:MAG TPA: Kdo hydroxylase family protein [Casimicrobiaceae bacterium]